VQEADTRKMSFFKKAAIAAGLLAAAFLIGYVPARARLGELEQDNSRLQRLVQVGTVRAHLGMACYEANRNNFASAGEHSTAFFNGLRELTLNEPDSGVQQKLQAFAAQRDDITAQLAAANPAVKDKLAQMYADFYTLPGK
jgi:hypothetical protein